MKSLLDLVRALPWALPVLVAGAVAFLGAGFALSRRRLGEASLGLAVHAAAVALVLAELGRALLGLAVLWVAVTLAAAAVAVAETARSVPGAGREAPGSEQRLLALAVAGLLGGAWAVAGAAVDWPGLDPVRVSALVVALALSGQGLAALLTRRHWVSLLFAGLVSLTGLIVALSALPEPVTAAFAAAFLLWGWGLGIATLGLLMVSLHRGQGPLIEAPPEPPR